ncbi:MAG: preprotein translocase subunit YajC [Anaerolineae bacterium]
MQGLEQTIILVAFIILMGGFMWWSQRRAKKRYEDKIASLEVGDQIVTIGGIFGEVVALDREAKQARLRIAPDVEVQIRLSAVGQRVGSDQQ